MARSKASASSTPGSVSMMTRKGPVRGLGLDEDAKAGTARELTAKALVDVVTN
jgi:hypothetical protein